MHIIYHPVTTGGADYSGGDIPGVCVTELGDPQSAWNGAEFTTVSTPVQSMTNAGNGDWTYDIADASFDTDTLYEITASATGAVTLSVTGTPAVLDAIFFADPSATSYAGTIDLATYLNVDQSVLSADSSRLLQRASDLVNDATLNRIDSKNTRHVSAARNATCAQVEFWMELGEDNDISGPVQSSQIGSTQIVHGAGMDRVSPMYLAPRAERFLRRAGLMNRGAKLK